MIEDYLYAGTYFREDPDLPLPEGEEWDDRGKKETIIYVFLYF